MGRAVLVMDIPNCCGECFALDDNGDYPVCLITQEQRGYTFKIREQKMDRCPLKSLPEKQVRDYPADDYVSGWDDGWDSCIEILSE